MTAYLMTEAQHAQIVEALTTRDLRLHEKCEVMLNAMNPVEPVACIYNGNQYMRHEFMNDKIPESSTPLYTLGDTA